MRLRVGQLVVAIALVTVSGCTSSSGTNGKSGGDWFQARPLLMPGRHATGVHPNLFVSLRAPATEDEYNRLSPEKQAALANALRGVDCAHPPQIVGNADRVLCDADSNVFLLGPALFTGHDVKSAKPVPPSASVAGWQVALLLTSGAGKKWAAWTSQNHARSRFGAFNDVQVASEPPPCGLTTTTACSDFTAFASDGVVVSVPVTFPAFGEVANSVAISGDFDEAFAIRIAHKLSR